MKNFIKNNIMGFVIGAIMFGSVGVYAGTLISSNDVTYNDKTAKQALDELYERVGTMYTKTEYTTAVNSSQVGSISVEEHPAHGVGCRCTVYNKAGQVIAVRNV